MITNIRDKRQRPYRWKMINAVAEPTWADNTVNDSDVASLDRDNDFVYVQLEGVTLAEAVEWAGKLPGEVTLYLYDEGAGTT